MTPDRMDAGPPPGSEAERAAFRRLSARLPALWRRILDEPDFAHTSVVVPSLSLDVEELAKVDGVAYYEERMLFSLTRLRHPRARVLYLTSRPVHEHVVDYYLQTLAGVPAAHARGRLQLLTVQDSSTEPLTAKLLRRPRLLARIRDWVGDPGRAYLTCFNSSPLERTLAVALDIPLNGVDPDLLRWGTKSGSREIFARSGVDCPAGVENLGSLDEAVDALVDLAGRRPGIARAVVKLDSGFAGEGNAVFTYPRPLPPQDTSRRRAIADALERLEYTAPGDDLDRYFGKFAAMGGVVEEYLAATQTCSPSVQMRITPDGAVEVLSSHEQLLGGATGQVFLGCRFPADEAYRALLQRHAIAIGEELRELGVVSRFGVDFMALRDPGGDWRVAAVEINLRMGGTTAPFQALEFLTGGALDAQSGSFLSRRGEAKHYVATDNLKSPAYRGLMPEDLTDIVVRRGLQFDPGSGTGVLFHMIGALSQHGKVGITCIGDTPEEADELFRWTTGVLDHETGAGPQEAGRPAGLLDRRVARME